MTAPPGTSLELLRAVVADDDEAVRRALSDREADIAAFLRFAHHHHLGAYVYWTLHRRGLTTLLSPRILAATKASSLAERTQTERLVRTLCTLRDHFEQERTRVLFIKGPLFAQRFYGSVDARGFADLDVLVQPHDLERIETLLLGLGFTRAFRVLVSRGVTRRFAHHFEYTRDEVPLDVHWVLQRHFTFRIDYARIWATAAKVPLAGRSFEATSDEYELVLQLLGILMDLQVGKLALRSLVDVYRVLETVDGAIDWEAFLAWRRRERILGPCGWVLGLVLDVLDCRARFPRLAALLAPTLRTLPPTSLAHAAVLESRPLAPGQKLLALRIYETPLAASLAWWLVSLPFRLAVYGVTRERLGPAG